VIRTCEGPQARVYRETFATGLSRWTFPASGADYYYDARTGWPGDETGVREEVRPASL
jgi:hypothetical protein